MHIMEALVRIHLVILMISFTFSADVRTKLRPFTPRVINVEAPHVHLKKKTNLQAQLQLIVRHYALEVR